MRVEVGRWFVTNMADALPKGSQCVREVGG